MNRQLGSGLVVGAAASVLLAIKLLAPERVDLTAVALLVVALLPWLSVLVESAELHNLASAHGDIRNRALPASAPPSAANCARARSCAAAWSR